MSLLGRIACKLNGHFKSVGKHTDQTKRKMSESRKGWKMPETLRLKLIESNRNRVVSEETREKM